MASMEARHGGQLLPAGSVHIHQWGQVPTTSMGAEQQNRLPEPQHRLRQPKLLPQVS